MKYKGCTITTTKYKADLHKAVITFPDHDTIGVYGRDEQDAKAKAKAAINAWLWLKKQG